ncbi:unnamed protein product [Calypogeia fissa]
MADARVEEVKRAVLVALDWRSTGETRQAATLYLESIKNGDVHILAEVGYALVRQQCPSEIRLYGFKMLQHLIRLRWEELKAPEEHLQMASMSLMMIEEIGKGHEQWALKSQAAALVAEVSRRGGVGMWNEVLPSLFNLSGNSPAHAELVAMVLRWLPEDVTVHNEDLEGERRRQLLFGLTQTLPQTLPFLFNLLELHFTATITLSAQNQEEVANQHASAVTATLFAVIAYAEWAPVTAMVEYRLVEACSALQQAPQFRLSACEVLKLIAARRKPADETGNLFVLAMMNVFDALAQASEAYLMNIAQWTSALGEAMGNRTSVMNGIDVDYGECLCEAMVALGSHNFQCVADDKVRVDVYIRKMLGFLQLPIYALHSKALPLWLTLLREAVSTLNNSKGEAEQVISNSSSTANGSAANSADKEKKGIAYSLITTDYCAVLLDLTYQRLLVKNSESKAASEDEDFTTPVDYSQYHSRLLELIRLLSTLQPSLAVSKVAQEIDANFVGDDFTQPSPQTLSTLESLQIMLEAVIYGIPENVLAAEASSRRPLGVLLEGIFERLYRVSWKVPALVELHGQYIDAMGSFLKHAQATFIQLAIDKLFALLESLPVIRMDNQVIDTAYAKGISRARLQVCTSFLRVAKAADSALLPHAMGIANRMTTMEADGHLSRGEVNLLGEALLIVGSAGGIAQQIQVLDWLLAPLRECWEQAEWQQRYLSSAGGLVDLVSGNNQIFAGKGTDGKSIHDQIWLVFHTVTFLERAYRRVGDFKRSKGNVVRDQQTMVLEDTESSNMARFFPLISHLKWIFPPLLKLLRCIHALWSESIMATLPGEVRGALAMGVPEQTSLLGTTLASSPEDGASQMEGTSGGMGTKENEIRTWLKGIRDSAYNMLGIAAARLGGGFFDDADGRAAALATALVENIEYMEMHHVRQLIHSVIIFFVKSCPRAQWGPWLGRMLPPILVHGQSVLSVSWASLMREGAVKPPKHWTDTSVGSNDGSSKAIKTEVILEKLLRDLSREYCNLLSVMASPALSPRQQPPGEQTAGAESSPIIGADSMLGFLMQHKEAALAALYIGIGALEWTDSEAVHKAASFCGAVVSMVSVLTEPELQDIVGQNMFPAAVRGLTLESNATAQAELIGLLREIYIRLASHSQAPRQLLLSLPSVTQEVLAAFEKALEKTASVKEQRQLMKTLLLAAGGDQLKALKAQKNMSVITNVTDRSLEGHRPGGGFPKPVDPGPLGLANIL